MSQLLEDLIQQRRDDTESYKQFLEQAEALAKQLGKKNDSSHPQVLDGRPEAIVLFNNLSDISGDKFSCPSDEQEKAELAIKIDDVMKTSAPADWKSDIEGPRGRQVINAIYPLMNRDRTATDAIFEIIKNQRGY